MYDNQQWTAVVWHQLDCDSRPDQHTARREWWQDWRSNTAMRLTELGLLAFKAAQQQGYEFAVPVDQLISSRHLLTLNRTITQPFYIQLGRKQKIILFGGQEATMYALYGDFARFVDALTA